MERLRVFASRPIDEGQGVDDDDDDDCLSHDGQWDQTHARLEPESVSKRHTLRESLGIPRAREVKVGAWHSRPLYSKRNKKAVSSFLPADDDVGVISRLVEWTHRYFEQHSDFALPSS